MNVIELTNEEYNAIMEARETLNEFNADVSAAYTARNAAERMSGKAGHNGVESISARINKRQANNQRDTGSIDFDLNDEKDFKNHMNNKNHKYTKKDAEERIKSSQYNQHVNNYYHGEGSKHGYSSRNVGDPNKNDRKREKKAAIKAKLAANK